MAGHSKWANIRFRKGAQDARRGKIFTKLIREITAACRVGGGDPGMNPRLRLAIDRAKAQSMPRDTIERAIKRGTGALDDVHYEEARYEGYGPGGVAVMVDCLTDNRNRTVADVRHAFTKHGGNLGADGSVAYLFRQAGQIDFPAGTDEDALLEAALEAGAADVVQNEDGSVEVLTEPAALPAVRDAFEKAGLTPARAEVTMRAALRVPVAQDDAETLLALLDALDDLDDVQTVHSNADLPEALLAAET